MCSLRILEEHESSSSLCIMLKDIVAKYTSFASTFPTCMTFLRKNMPTARRRRGDPGGSGSDEQWLRLVSSALVHVFGS